MDDYFKASSQPAAQEPDRLGNTVVRRCGVPPLYQYSMDVVSRVGRVQPVRQRAEQVGDAKAEGHRSALRLLCKVLGA